MATIASGSFTSAGTSSPWQTLTGRNVLYRGPAISSAVTVEIQDVGNSDATAITRTGDTMTREGTFVLDAGFEGTLQYRLTCTVLGDTSLAWRISK